MFAKISQSEIVLTVYLQEPFYLLFVMQMGVPIKIKAKGMCDLAISLSPGNSLSK